MSEKIRNRVAFIVWIFCYFSSSIFLRFFLSIKIYYKDKNFKNLKKPIIVVSNHKSPFDPWVLSVAMPFRQHLKISPVRPFARKDFPNKKSFLGALSFLGILSFLYYIYNVITIPDVDSFEGKTQPLLDALNNKNSILMFPEGKMILKEDVGEFKKGVVYLQEKTGVPILPCAVRYGGKGLFRRKVFVSFGEVLYLPKRLFRNKDDYFEAREYLRGEILSLYKKSDVG